MPTNFFFSVMVGSINVVNGYSLTSYSAIECGFDLVLMYVSRAANPFVVVPYGYNASRSSSGFTDASKKLSLLAYNFFISC